MMTYKLILTKTARPIELVLAAVFLVGAVLKAYDINLFVVQISHYGVLTDRSLIRTAALLTLSLETGLAAALLLKIRLNGVTYAGIMGLLAGFTGLILYGWIFHGLKDCGCFGPVEMSPGVTIGKNFLIAGFAVAAWAGLAWNGRLRSSWRNFTATAPVAVLAALVISAYSYAHIETEAPADAPVFAQFVFESEYGETTDLGEGEYLIVIMNTRCDHCMASVPKINALAAYPGVPPVVALCIEEQPGGIQDFKDMTLPEFPLFSMGDNWGKFFSLIGSAPPRYSLTRDGVQTHYWDEEAPKPADIIEALSHNLSNHTG